VSRRHAVDAIRRWLSNHAVPRCVLPATGLIAGVLPAAAQLRAGQPVQVSAARSGEAHYEVLVAAHPTDPGRLLVGSMVQPAGSAMISGSIAYITEDGGATWRPTLETPPADASGASSGDPAVAFGPDGSAWFVASLIPPGPDRTAREMLLYRSADGGRRWDATTRFTYSDREYITIDASGGRYQGRVYVNGNGRIGANAGGLTNFYSADAGRTFTESVPSPQPAAPVMGNSVVLSDGALVVLHSAAAAVRDGQRAGEDAAPADAMRVRLLASASRDGGRSFEPPYDIAIATLVSGRKGGHNNTSNLPVMAADGSARSTRDRLYIVWPEHDGTGTSIRLSWSADRGATWSPARLVADAQMSGRDHFMPAVAVNRDGVVGVLWYDRRDRADNIGWDVRFAASLDGGVTFLPSVRVSGDGTRFGSDDAWIVEARAATTPDGTGSLDLSLNTFTFLGGDTAGLVADAAGIFHAVWVDNSSGVPQVWTAPITVGMAGESGAGASLREGAATPGRDGTGVHDAARTDRVDGSGTPATRRVSFMTRPGRDRTESMTMEVSDPRYDRATNMLTVRVRLRNTSTQSISPNLVLSAGALRSELGEATAINADSAVAGAGGTAGGNNAANSGRLFWSFAAAQGDTLQPGSYTETRTLEFRLTGLRPFRDGNRYRRGLVNFTWTAVVY
jgi:hypothetical protein